MIPEQSFNSFGAFFTLCMCIALLAVPRRWVVLPVALTMCCMTLGQGVVLGGINLPSLRLVILAIWARILIREEYRDFRMQRMDWTVCVWVICSVVVYTALWRSSEALINRLGLAYNTMALYFAFRMWIRTLGDGILACRCFILGLIPLAVLMSIERLTGYNYFSVFGGVPSVTVIRQGIMRCQGPFAHPILAGTCGAVWLPLSIAMWWQRDMGRVLSVIGVVCCTAITATSGSSGPLMTFVVGLAGVLAWPARRYVKHLPWVSVALLCGLQLFMKDPVWFVLARANILSGSTGWHRSFLIDRAIANFSDWWLVGIRDVAEWGVWAGDITNHYLLEGLRGGLITLSAFIWVLVLGFRCLGIGLARARPLPWRIHILIWAAGATLFAHVITFFSIAYFDQQSIVNWYLLMAFTAALPQAVGVLRARQQASVRAAVSTQDPSPQMLPRAS